jgi:NarL family two-component system response regulator LiaR
MIRSVIRIVIVDDHPVVRQGLRLMLEQRPDLEVVGEGADGAQAIALATELVPDVLLLDLLMPGVDGIGVLREIKRLTPATQVIVLTSYAEDDYILNAINAGALSYLLKDASPEELVAAVRAATRGESVLHPVVAARVLREVRSRERSAWSDLTPRELEVLTHVARGRSNQEIARELVLSEATVRTHMANILSKLHLADRTQAAIYALQQRLVSLDDAGKGEPR